MVLASVVGAYYYLRVVWYMYFEDPEDKSVFQAGGDMQAVLSLNGLAVLALGHRSGLAAGPLSRHSGVAQIGPLKALLSEMKVR